MAQIEQLEPDAHRSKIVANMRKLFEKYRAIFDWDIPEVRPARRRQAHTGSRMHHAQKPA